MAGIVLQSPAKEIRIGTATLMVEVANTDVLREKGLSGQMSLEENKGILFLFEKPGRYGFWMKDMNFTIDIIWIDKDKKIVEVMKNIDPETFPETFYSQELVQYVVETRAGWAKENDIRPGDKVLGL